MEGHLVAKTTSWSAVIKVIFQQLLRMGAKDFVSWFIGVLQLFDRLLFVR